MKVTPELIPPGEFHKGRWLLGVERPAWYYFLRGGSPGPMISNSGFLESVDTPLRELVRFLHERGIGTTPSCSGHHCAERDLSAVHGALVKDAVAIRSDGLVLRDVETAETFVFQDPGYRLPWDEKDFIERMKDYQQQGVLGIRLSRYPVIAARLSALRIQRVRLEMRDGIIFFFTKEADEDGIKQVWARITQAVMNEFHGYDKRTPTEGMRPPLPMRP